MSAFVSIPEGTRFTRWTVLRLWGWRHSLWRDKFGKRHEHIRALYECECSCDKHTVRVVLSNNLRRQLSRSCGCLQRLAAARTMRNIVQPLAMASRAERTAKEKGRKKMQFSLRSKKEDPQDATFHDAVKELNAAVEKFVTVCADPRCTNSLEAISAGLPAWTSESLRQHLVLKVAARRNTQLQPTVASTPVNSEPLVRIKMVRDFTKNSAQKQAAPNPNEDPIRMVPLSSAKTLVAQGSAVYAPEPHTARESAETR